MFGGGGGGGGGEEGTMMPRFFSRPSDHLSNQHCYLNRISFLRLYSLRTPSLEIEPSVFNVPSLSQ